MLLHYAVAIILYKMKEKKECIQNMKI